MPSAPAAGPRAQQGAAGPCCQPYARGVRVLVAMSGGVDSSVAAALAVAGGHQVVGATLKLWGGEGDSGCCSVADVDDARRVADHLGIDHHVFNLGEAFEDAVVGPYVAAHARGDTPNPCVECNRHIKFGALLQRARRLGFDALATGHHARLVPGPRGPRLARGVDAAKDQSYVLAMLGRAQLDHLLLPVGELTKAEVRAQARRAGLRTADKPDSQDVCFIRSDEGRRGFLGRRLPLHPGDLVDADTGEVVGRVPAVELVTVGQRRGLAAGGGPGERRYAVAVDVPNRRVVVGPAARAVATAVAVATVTLVDDARPAAGRVLAQATAHGAARPATVALAPDRTAGTVTYDEPQRPVAPGQTVAFYDPDRPDVVVGSAVAVAPGTLAGGLPG